MRLTPVGRHTGGLQRAMLALLSAAFLLTVVLVLSAYRAERARERAVARAMQDYAAFANWQLGRLVRDNIYTIGFVSTFATIPLMRNPRLAPGLSAEEFGTLSACVPPATGTCYDNVLGTVRFDVETGYLEYAPAAQDVREVPRWVRPALMRIVQETPHVARGTPRLVPPRSESANAVAGPMMDRSNFVHGIAFSRAPGDPVAFPFLLIRFADGRPAQIYGVLVPARRFLGAIMASIVKSEQLLPRSVTGRIPTDSILQIVAATAQGEVLFQNRARIASGYVHRDSLGILVGDLRVVTTLAPQVAQRLAVGHSVPTLGLPALVLLLLTIGALLAATAVQLQRQQDFARMRSDFVASVSHELRTPLAQIRLLAELLRMGKPASAVNRERSLLIIDQEARRLSNLVENILTFSRPGGAQRLSLHLAALTPLVVEAIEAFAPLAASRAATITFDASHEAPMLLNEFGMRQVLINLLDNAVRYGPPGQTVRVRVAVNDAHVLLTVDDEGPGVPTANRQHIWEPYFRLARDEASPRGGTGLGLAVVRDIVHGHGGTMWVEDRSGTPGARFVMSFPAIADEPAPRHLEHDTAHGTQRTSA